VRRARRSSRADRYRSCARCAVGREGWHVFATVRRADDAASLGTAFGSAATALIADVTDAAAPSAARDRVAEHLAGGRSALCCSMPASRSRTGCCISARRNPPDARRQRARRDRDRAGFCTADDGACSECPDAWWRSHRYRGRSRRLSSALMRLQACARGRLRQPARN